jgi:uncharacterized protein YbjQ (UPF0145 family)
VKNHLPFLYALSYTCVSNYLQRKENRMIITTTSTLDGRTIQEYKGIVASEVIYGSNFVRDFFARITDVVGGRSSSYQRVIGDARKEAIREMMEQASGMGANAIIGVDFDYEVIGESMLMVSASGTAVKVI